MNHWDWKSRMGPKIYSLFCFLKNTKKDATHEYINVRECIIFNIRLYKICQQTKGLRFIAYMDTYLIILCPYSTDSIHQKHQHYLYWITNNMPPMSNLFSSSANLPLLAQPHSDTDLSYSVHVLNSSIYNLINPIQ